MIHLSSLDLNPDFQHCHLWLSNQQSKLIEDVLLEIIDESVFLKANIDKWVQSGGFVKKKLGRPRKSRISAQAPCVPNSHQ